MDSTLTQRLTDDMKTAMRSKDAHRLGVIRLIRAAIKQREIDERIELDDSQVLAILDKMNKQRRDSIEQYVRGDRPDLAEIERAEIEVIKGYLPPALSEAEIDTMISNAIATSGASSAKDMGKVIGLLKNKLQGRADMGAVSGQIKAKLGA
ncbi:Transamidase GatB domain protein [hydrothermal vent metagenome]|uniref:Transamidase GatB domain protein n=1 Tax=hydrothermal vent metagenome TaxID=652676 RepID=A0A3B0ZF83_9ZZZZ